ncbi:MAG: DMT family transporter [Anaerolineae bacterium]|nr:DMT family transporter [Anaerolineae bacterium]
MTTPSLSTTAPATRRNAILILLLTGFLWSSSGLFVKLISWEPLAILGGRSFLAGLVLLAYLRTIPTGWNRWQIGGALAYMLTQLLFIIATKLTTAANVIFLQFTSPLYIIFFAYWILRERPQRADWLLMPVIFLGMGLFFGDDLSFDGLLGNVLAIISAVTMAFMIVMLRAQKSDSPAKSIFLGNVIGAAIGLPFIFQEAIAAVDLGIILYLGLIQIGLSMVLYTMAIKHVPALESTLIVTIEPVLNPVWVFLVIGEVPGLMAIVGGVLVLGAVTTRAIISARPASETLQEPGLLQSRLAKWRKAP